LKGDFGVLKELSELNEQPLDMFGADEVEMWFTVKEVSDLLLLLDRLRIWN
jgi:hypothetical protein